MGHKKQGGMKAPRSSNRPFFKSTKSWITDIPLDVLSDVPATTILDEAGQPILAENGDHLSQE